MKIGILTFHASHNYGSMLQAWALQTLLTTREGHEVSIINLRRPIQRKVYAEPLPLRHPRALVRNFLHNPSQAIAGQQKYLRFEAFLRKELNVTAECHSLTDVQKHIEATTYDALIVGSDQIWNLACLDFDESFLLTFPYKGKRVAYAPSLGPTPEANNAKWEKYKELLLQFKALSTREQRGAEFLRDLTGREVKVVLDPTLLLETKDYEALLHTQSEVTEPYLFYYSPLDDEHSFQMAQQYAKSHGLPIVVTQNYEHYQGSNIIRKFNCGPNEFLQLIRNASITCGKSFHLLAFSLIFHKPFFSIGGQTDSRLQNLLTSLGIKERTDETMFQGSVEEIDYTKVDNNLCVLKASSRQYLKDAIK